MYATYTLLSVKLYLRGLYILYRIQKAAMLEFKSTLIDRQARYTPLIVSHRTKRFLMCEKRETCPSVCRIPNEVCTKNSKRIISKEKEVTTFQMNIKDYFGWVRNIVWTSWVAVLLLWVCALRSICYGKDRIAPLACTIVSNHLQ
jgi:hypothetical protein